MSTAQDALDKIQQIRDRKGVSFVDFCEAHATEKGEMLQFSFKPQPDDPTLKDRDNAKTASYIARAGYLHAKARGYALKARGTATWALLANGEKVSVVSDLSKKHIADFEEEAYEWEAIIDGLHERLWTGRGEMRRLNRGE